MDSELRATARDSDWVETPANHEEAKEAGKEEEALRARMAQYWEAMQSKRYEQAEACVYPDQRKLFAYQIKKPNVLKWKIDKLDFNEGWTECDTVTLATIPVAMFSMEIDFPIENKWVLHGGEWYFKIPWNAGENPALGLFQKVDWTKRALEQKAAAGDPEKAKVVRTQSIREFRPDSSNPVSVRFGEKATFRFSYKNNSPQPIRIVSAHADCHCTDVQQDHARVEPGGTGEIAVAFDSFGMPLGVSRKDVVIQFDDLADSLVLNFKLEVRPNFRLSPESVDFGVLKPGATSYGKVQLSNLSDQTVRILSKLNSDPKVEVVLSQDVIEPGGHIVVSVNYMGSPQGPIRDSVTLQTDLVAQPILNITVRGQVHP